jgi:hypothetical protein
MVGSLRDGKFLSDGKPSYNQKIVEIKETV